MKRLFAILVSLSVAFGAFQFTWPEWEFIHNEVRLCRVLHSQDKIAASFNNGVVYTEYDASGIVISYGDEELNIGIDYIGSYLNIYDTVMMLRDFGIDSGSYTTPEGWTVQFNANGIQIETTAKKTITPKTKQIPKLNPK